MNTNLTLVCVRKWGENWNLPRPATRAISPAKARAGGARTAELALKQPAGALSLAGIIAILFCCLTCCAMDKLEALSQIESGGNDRARGRHGEIGRYQCLKSVWRNATAEPYSSATNAAIATNVTLGVITARTGHNPAELTPERFATAWHCPSAKRLNREQRDYIRRFCNLCKK